MLSYSSTPVITIEDRVLEKAGIQLLMKREDLNHPFVSGNKWWKLKYNLEEARNQNHRTLLTFGGAWSNHIYATAAAARECGFKSIGVIRGEETLPLNHTLTFATECGMELHYVSREIYRRKNDTDFIESLRDKFGDFYLIPEGGSNVLAVKGVKEFAETMSALKFDYLCVPMGTGGTLAGLVAGLKGRRKIIGFSSLKGGAFLQEDVKELLTESSLTDYGNWRIETNYHHGGYAKTTPELMKFIEVFEKEHGIPLDQVYTGKMMYGIFDMVEKGIFDRGSVLLTVHTGGLQGRMRR